MCDRTDIRSYRYTTPMESCEIYLLAFGKQDVTSLRSNTKVLSLTPFGVIPCLPKASKNGRYLLQ